MDSVEKLRKAKESSIANFISKLKIRREDVYERLANELQIVKDNGVLWHSSCYASYISSDNLKSVQKISNEKRYGTEENNEDTVQDHGGRILRSMVPTTDWSKCIFCENRTHRKNRELHSVSTLEACNTILDTANSKRDEEILNVRGVNNDLIAANAKYHKVRHACYVGKRNIEYQASKLEVNACEVSPCYEQAFKKMAGEIKKGLESGKAYDMTSLLAKYISLLNEKGVNGESFTEDEFKTLLRDHFTDSVVFHQPRNRMKPERIYSSTFSLKDVVQDGEDCLEDKTQKKTDGTNQLTQDTENPIYQAAKMIKADIKKCQGISLYPLNVNDITLTTAKKIVPPSLYWFLQWLIANDKFEQKDDNESCPNDADERRILSLAHDVILCTSHGQKELPKHISLAISGSSLHRFKADCDNV